jgi:hypothetical protein
MFVYRSLEFLLFLDGKCTIWTILPGDVQRLCAYTIGLSMDATRLRRIAM